MASSRVGRRRSPSSRPSAATSKLPGWPFPSSQMSASAAASSARHMPCRATRGHRAQKRLYTIFDHSHLPCIQLAFHPPGLRLSIGKPSMHPENHGKHNVLRPQGGHPEQTQLLTDRAMFTEAYAVIPKGVLRDIVTSHLPFWDNMRMWVLSRPLSASPKPFPVHRGAWRRRR